ERRFADAMENQRLGKCRWLGRFKTEIQAYLTGICLNCKKNCLFNFPKSSILSSTSLRDH
ncbi:MAG: hypothetical protein QME57_00965, partial [Patescibacteria group bacterium]|nr:hypothetical protein [Patescibacteria group bacterium]